MLSWTYTSIVDYPRSYSIQSFTRESISTGDETKSFSATGGQSFGPAGTELYNNVSSYSVARSILSNGVTSISIKRGFTSNTTGNSSLETFISSTNSSSTSSASNSDTDTVNIGIAYSATQFRSSVYCYSSTKNFSETIISVSQQLFNLFSRVTSVESTFSTYRESGATFQFRLGETTFYEGSETTYSDGSTNIEPMGTTQTPESITATTLVTSQVSTSATFLYNTTSNTSVEIDSTTIQTLTSTIRKSYTTLITNQNTIFTTIFSSNFSPPITFSYTLTDYTTGSISKKTLTQQTGTVTLNTDGNMIIVTIYEVEDRNNFLLVGAGGGFSKELIVIPPQLNTFSNGLVPIESLSTYTRYTSYNTHWETYLVAQDSGSANYSGTTFSTSSLTITRLSSSNVTGTRYINQNIFTNSNSTAQLVKNSIFTTTSSIIVTDYNNMISTNSFTARSALIFNTTRYFASVVTTTYNAVVNNGSQTQLETVNGSFSSFLSKDTTILLGGSFPTSSSFGTGTSSETGTGGVTISTSFTQQSESGHSYYSSSSTSSTLLVAYDLNQRAIYITSNSPESFHFISQQGSLYQPPSLFGPNENLYERLSFNGDFGTSVKSLIFRNAIGQPDNNSFNSSYQALIFSNLSRSFTDSSGSYTSYLNNGDKKIYVSTISENQSTADTFTAEIIGVGNTSQFRMGSSNAPASYGGIVADSRVQNFTVLNYPMAIVKYTTVDGTSSGSFISTYINFNQRETSNIFYARTSIPALSYIGNADGLAGPAGTSTFRSSMSTFIPF